MAEVLTESDLSSGGVYTFCGTTGTYTTKCVVSGDFK